MKNILVIDGAENCSFSVCLVDDEDFAELFPARGQDVEFVEDLVVRVGKHRAGQLVQRATTRRDPQQPPLRTVVLEGVSWPAQVEYLLIHVGRRAADARGMTRARRPA